MRVEVRGGVNITLFKLFHEAEENGTHDSWCDVPQDFVSLFSIKLTNKNDHY